ncbi:diphthamide biosynthesis protein 1 [Kwoniella dejecticola CBS 10117]|uniref:2-(3-amino-3-carboxypropyl)histidine synthase subunit 1 n=1 Tax=Kwoniella dejecticola CBS 10117 TaxID=1296121 RepID=A0A1A5ZVN9_9TREE|nr:diphthamide biosynthesis protein 1 [Kwoniella dejecticola CBS 10117]OBR81874.1 diphthamide biosynthesis protein 1 [Kwoniella dejecticola CBS 10117]
MDAVEGIDKPTKGTQNTSEASGSKPKPRKRFVGSSKPSSSRTPIRKVANQVPDDILNDPHLNAAIKGLPGNYNFEIHKTIHHIRRDGVKSVALQMPEGLMMYGCAIADIIETFTGALPMLLADVTYGACCIDDYTAKEMGAEMIVHYGHSCLIPVSQTTLKTLYIFVEIAIDTTHLCLSVRRNFPSSRESFRRLILGAGEAEPGAAVPITLEESDQRDQKRTDTIHAEDVKEEDLPTRLALVSTIQFVASIQNLRDDLDKAMPPPDEVDPSKEEKDGALLKVNKGEIGVWRGKYEVTIPQVRPLSPGEVLGCTAPKLKDVDGLIYVGDGRFHLESIMIANPTVPAFRYDPYSKKFTRETYEHTEMRGIRGEAVKTARKGLVEKGSGSWAVLLGTLGRQGSLSVLKSITSTLPPDSIPPLLILLSELSPLKLSLFSHEEISTFIQTSCPRLSIDWGYAFSRPLLSPYEASVASGRVRGWGGLDLAHAVPLNIKGRVKAEEQGEGDYPMDFYSDNSLGPWTPRHKVKA